MKLPEIQNADKYTGLYVVDFGDRCSVGFTAEEVAELLESEQFADAQVYKVHRANPDGTLELKGISKGTFQLETGMLFYAADETAGRSNFVKLVEWADKQLPPARSKVQLADTGDAFITALIYPAESDDAFSHWLVDGDYFTNGQVEAGIGAVQQFYNMNPNILERKQLWPAPAIEQLHGGALMEATNRVIVR